MKAAFILLLLQPSLKAQSLLEKPVSLRVSAMPVPEALAQLTKKNEVSLAFSERFFDNKKKVTVRAKDRPVRLVLQEILYGTGVGFKEVSGQIVLFLLPAAEVQQMTLSGFVEDAESGEKLIAATVYCPELGHGTVTNEYGFYRLTLATTACNLQFNYIGYNEERVVLTKKEDQRINLAIKPALTLAEIIVMPTDRIGDLLPSPSSLRRLRPEDFKMAPDLGGQSDLYRAIQMLPGVQTNADGIGGLSVRGGNADQNLVLMDGTPVYNADHLLGMFSIFNTSAIRSAKMLKGGIPARYGGRISSVLDVYTKEGNQNKWCGEAGTDLIGAKIVLEGPLGHKKGSLMVSGRHTHSDFYLMPAVIKLMAMEEFVKKDYRFYDFNAKLNYNFSDKDKIYLSFYRGNDFFGGQEEYVDGPSYNKTNYELRWGNTITSLRWNHLISQKLFSNTSLTYSHFNFSLGLLGKAIYQPEPPDGESFVFTTFLGMESDIQDVAWKSDFDYAPSTDHYLRFGADLTWHRLSPFVSVFQNEVEDTMAFDSLSIADFLNQQPVGIKNALSFNAYLEDEWRLGKKMTANTGLRLAGFHADGKTFLLPEPRLSMAFQLNAKQKLTASLTRTTQFLHRVETAGQNFPADYWTPSNISTGPQKAWQGTLGIDGELPKGMEFSLEVYHKMMNGLLAFPDSFYFDPFLEETNPEDAFISIEGNSKGLELLLRREEGRIGGWVGYGLTKTTRHSIWKNAGKPYAFNYDRRHELKLFGYFRLTDHWQASFNWVYGSPNPTLTDEGSLPAPLGQVNVARATTYHRLDLALSFSKKTGRLDHQFKASIYNAYSRKNVAFQILSYDELGNMKLSPIYLFPAMLGLNYSLRF